MSEKKEWSLLIISIQERMDYNAYKMQVLKRDIAKKFQ